MARQVPRILVTDDVSVIGVEKTQDDRRAPFSESFGDLGVDHTPDNQ
jgi:hypothetical protein